MRFGRILSLLLIAAPILAFAWAFGGLRATALVAVMPWTSLACALGIFLLPQRRHEEGWCAAEKRVLKGIVTDPFFWVAAAFMVYLAIPLFNVSLCPSCDWRAIDAGANPYPPCRFLPFCANRADHMGVIWWFGPALLAAVGVRQALVRAGRRAFYELLVWQAAALALLGFVQVVTGAKLPYWEATKETGHFFSVFAYPNMGGAFFAFSYALALGLWSHRMEQIDSIPIDAKASAYRHKFIRANYPLVAVVLTLAGAIATLCRAAMLGSAVLTAIFFLYIFLHAFSEHDWLRARRFKSAIVAAFLMLSVFGAIFVYAPPEVTKEVKSLNSYEVANRVSGKGQYHTRIAGKIMRDFPFFGVGGWGYKHFSPVYLTDEDFRKMQTQGGINVHNDYLQFLVEFGLVGFALLAACMWLLAAPAGRAWRAIAVKALSVQRKRLSNMDASLAAFLVEPPLFWSFFACAFVLVHAFGDCPLRSGAVLAEVLVILPIATGFLTHKEIEQSKKG